jgi:predicted component of type VI protein secretion system
VLSLEVISGNATGSTIQVEDELLVGRLADGDGRLGDDPELSRYHARLSREADGSFALEDLGSSNGSFINGRQIDCPELLSVGDSVEVGATTLVVRNISRPAPPVAPAPAAPAGAAVDPDRTVFAPAPAAEVAVDPDRTVFAPAPAPAAEVAVDPDRTVFVPAPAVEADTAAPVAEPDTVAPDSEPVPDSDSVADSKSVPDTAERSTVGDPAAAVEEPAPAIEADPDSPAAAGDPAFPPPLELTLSVDFESRRARIGLGDGQEIHLVWRSGRWISDPAPE